MLALHLAPFFVSSERELVSLPITFTNMAQHLGLCKYILRNNWAETNKDELHFNLKIKHLRTNKPVSSNKKTEQSECIIS